MLAVLQNIIVQFLTPMKNNPKLLYYVFFTALRRNNVSELSILTLAVNSIEMNYI